LRWLLAFSWCDAEYYIATDLEEKKPYNSFHLAKYIILNIFVGVLDKYIKVLADRIYKNPLPVVATAKRCIFAIDT